MENNKSDNSTPPSGGRGANIFAISGSLRAGSSNHNILRYIDSLLPSDVNYHIYGALSSIPSFDPELDNDTPPESVIALRNAINDADVIVICTPEYAFGIPGQLKNALDWLVSSSTLVDKPVVLITASLGGENAHAAMRLTLGALSANITDTLLINFIRSKIDADGNVTDEEVKIGLEQVANKLLTVIDHKSSTGSD